MPPNSLSIPEAIHRAAEQVIENDNKLVIRAYGVIHSTEDFMRAFIRKVMEKYGRIDLAPAVEIVVKELVMNAAKANFKKIYFAEHNLDLDNPAHFESGMAGFRNIIDENIFVDYGKKAREAQLIVETSFDFDKDRVIVQVRNNVPMAAHEEKRAREKLKQGLECNDMVEFMMEHMDDADFFIYSEIMHLLEEAYTRIRILPDGLMLIEITLLRIAKRGAEKSSNGTPPPVQTKTVESTPKNTPPQAVIEKKVEKISIEPLPEAVKTPKSDDTKIA